MTSPDRWDRTASPRPPGPASGNDLESVERCWPAQGVWPWDGNAPAPAQSRSSGVAQLVAIFPPPSAARHNRAGHSRQRNVGKDGAQAEPLSRP